MNIAAISKIKSTYCQTNKLQTNCTITIAIINFKTAAMGNRNMATHCQTV